MEENKPWRVDFHCGATGERCVSARDDDGAASGIQCGEPLPGLEIGRSPAAGGTYR